MKGSDISARRLATQYELSRIFGSGAWSLERAAERALAVIAGSLDCVVSELWVLDATASGLRWIASWSAPGVDSAAFESAARSATFRSGEGLPGLVLERNAPQWMRDVGSEREFARRKEAAQLDVKTAIAFPVQFGGELTGVIQFFSRTEREPEAPLLDVFADVGSQVGTFLERARITELAREQSVALLELSTPILRLADRVLLAPVIGSLDDKRAEHARDRIVDAVVETAARVVVIDVSGVPHLDTHVARFMLETLHSLRLVGARVILTGVRAALAQTLVRLGLNLDEVEAAGTLADGLKKALAQD